MESKKTKFYKQSWRALFVRQDITRDFTYIAQTTYAHINSSEFWSINN